MKILEIEIGDKLLKETENLARRHYGDGDIAAVSRVVENALGLRLMLWELLGDPGQEVEEPITIWEPQEPKEEKRGANIQDWLFRRGETI